MSTDYDCWKESEEAVSVEAVVANLTGNASFSKTLLQAVLPVLFEKLHSKFLKSVNEIESSITFIVMTAPDKRVISITSLKFYQNMVPLEFIIPQETILSIWCIHVDYGRHSWYL
ncbi:hypothetical protein BC833DRAFT_570610 [Globomyces pollinis-pini]|nr:hypothetical protein BC833DRAFT_570610 [Globomyces pollinis-pini]